MNAIKFKEAFPEAYAEITRDLTTPMRELRAKVEDLKGMFDGYPYDQGAGSSGWDKAIDAVLELFPETP